MSPTIAELTAARDAAAQAYGLAFDAHVATLSGPTYRDLDVARTSRRNAQDALDAASKVAS